MGRIAADLSSTCPTPPHPSLVEGEAVKKRELEARVKGLIHGLRDSGLGLGGTSPGYAAFTRGYEDGVAARASILTAAQQASLDPERESRRSPGPVAKGSSFQADAPVPPASRSGEGDGEGGSSTDPNVLREHGYDKAATGLDVQRTANPLAQPDPVEDERTYPQCAWCPAPDTVECRADCQRERANQAESARDEAIARAERAEVKIAEIQATGPLPGQGLTWADPADLERQERRLQAAEAERDRLEWQLETRTKERDEARLEWEDQVRGYEELERESRKVWHENMDRLRASLNREGGESCT